MTSKKIGIIHVDRHADIQEKDLDERMHTCPWFHVRAIAPYPGICRSPFWPRPHSHLSTCGQATDLPNVSPKNLVQIGIGGWQVPRPAVKEIRDRGTNIITMDDIEDLGMDKVAEIALERAWDGTDAVYLSYDIDSIEAAFVPCVCLAWVLGDTGWGEGGWL